MKCKHGDLAIIVDDFVGCEGNIGLIVRVIGPAKIVNCMHCWQVVPMTGQPMWLLDYWDAYEETITDKLKAIHPDKWLRPIRGNTQPVIEHQSELS